MDPIQGEVRNISRIYNLSLVTKCLCISFVGWNHWPCADLDDPEMSAGIPEWSDSIAVVSKTQWAVEMISMLFERYVLDETTNTHSWVVVDDSLFNFGQNGRDSIRVILDTGELLSMRSCRLYSIIIFIPHEQVPAAPGLPLL